MNTLKMDPTVPRHFRTEGFVKLSQLKLLYMMLKRLL